MNKETEKKETMKNKFKVKLDGTIYEPGTLEATDKGWKVIKAKSDDSADKAKQAAAEKEAADKAAQVAKEAAEKEEAEKAAKEAEAKLAAEKAAGTSGEAGEGNDAPVDPPLVPDSEKGKKSKK